jgi:hypothetical protein
MRMIVVTAVMFWIASSAVAVPATAPTTRTADMEPLLEGVIRYQPPAGWELVRKSDTNLQANYKTADGIGRIEINVSPQTRDVPPTFAQQMAKIIGKGVREDADRNSNTILMQPRVEKDERFLLRMHDRTAGAEGTCDRVQLYRVMGLNIVHVAASAQTDSPEQAKAIHAVGESLLETMRLSRGPKRIVFPRSQLKIISPVDWTEKKSDQANGLVVTYHDPKDLLRQLIVRSRVLPTDARENGPRRDAILDRMIDEERRQPPFATPPKEEQTLDAGKNLRQIRTVLARPEFNLRVETRYFVVGESLVSVRSVAREDDEAIGQVASTLVKGITVIRE